MGKFIDMKGQKFGRVTVIRRDRKYPIEHNLANQQVYWLCKCDCGNPDTFTRTGASLRNTKNPSCGKCSSFELKDKIFGMLTALYCLDQKTSDGRTIWHCRCSCVDHNEVDVVGSELKRGNVQSCGCLRKDKGAEKAKGLAGQVFGRLTALYPTDKRAGNYVIWHCKCNCDLETECDVASSHLLQGKVISCGCIHSRGEYNIALLLKNNDIEYEKEKSFDDLVNIATNKKYRYDFYLPEYHRLIEFDGEQHYQSENRGWSTKEKLEKTQTSDKAKNEYALSHNIDLVRIPYTRRDDMTLDDLLGDQYLIKGDDLS